MKIGFIKPNYPYEKRVAVLPEHIVNSPNELIIEQNFGEYLDIQDEAYSKVGAKIESREHIFATCDIIFCMKLIQESDYDKLREGQTIIGWTHPTGSGTTFMQNQAIPKKLIIVDLDNIYPAVYYLGKKYPISFIKPNFIWRNSYNAGLCAVYHAVLAHGILPDSNTKVAVLSIGNVSQGAVASISKFNTNTRIFYRKTMHLFYETLEEYDIIINGIEVENSNEHILTKEQQKRLKKGCYIIDAAADAGNAIEGTHYTTIGNPIYEENGLYFYVVNNAPSILFRETSRAISESFAKVVYNADIRTFLDLIRNE
ncbi:hypothetical protein [uncultured Sanguibacteroides sp.]|uniref:hypothetical protein n=1 Tax=uncultured Sanguibacteroides sp. TaxID=1635151 RepID=UPI002600C143|nr:hypothetical protein [uncultured Sanguibacteroides sp.]